MTKKLKPANRNKKITAENRPLIVVTTGGSGGHIFPAEAIAAALVEQNYRVVFVTDKRGAAFHSLPTVQTYRLAAESVAGRSIFHKLTAAAKLFWGAVQGIHLMAKLRPSLVIGVGGYASFPAVMAAQMCHIPVILHEQNAVLGRANRVLANSAKLIVTSFEPTLMIPGSITAVRVGMPARAPIIRAQHSPYPKEKSPVRLLIFGGSQGATFFSRTFPEVLKKLPKELQKKIVITQQARAEDLDYLKAFYQKIPFQKVTIAAFFDNMPALLKESHLVICRGGASTITELEIIGRPAMIVPLPTAADNHQMENARQFCDDGAGWLINEKTFDVDKTAKRLQELLEAPETLKEAAQNAYKRSKPQAAQQVAELARNIIRGKGA